jgi:hypothetical protein
VSCGQLMHDLLHTANCQRIFSDLLNTNRPRCATCDLRAFSRSPTTGHESLSDWNGVRYVQRPWSVRLYGTGDRFVRWLDRAAVPVGGGVIAPYVSTPDQRWHRRRTSWRSRSRLLPSQRDSSRAGWSAFPPGHSLLPTARPTVTTAALRDLIMP